MSLLEDLLNWLIKSKLKYYTWSTSPTNNHIFVDADTPEIKMWLSLGGYSPILRPTGTIQIEKIFFYPLQDKTIQHDVFLSQMLHEKRTIEFAENGLLKVLFPELMPCYKFDGGHHHGEDVLTHMIETYEASKALNFQLSFRMAAFLHDIGKPSTFKMIDGKATFHGHDKAGADITRKFLTRISFQMQPERVEFLVRNHMWRFDEDFSDKIIKKWLYKVGKEWYSLYQLRKADRMGNRANIDKPSETVNMKKLYSKVKELIGKNPVYCRELLKIKENMFPDLFMDNEVYTNLIIWVNKDYLKRNDVDAQRDFVYQKYGNSKRKPI